MQFPIVPATTLLALAASATAADNDFTVEFTAPYRDSVVPSNANYTITWRESTGEPTGSRKVTLGLAGGKTPNTLMPCGILTRTKTDGSATTNDVGWFEWDVKEIKPDGTNWDCPDAWADLEANLFGISLTFEDENASKPEHWSDPFKITDS